MRVSVEACVGWLAEEFQPLHSRFGVWDAVEVVVRRCDVEESVDGSCFCSETRRMPAP
jgi:hypothetical protein